MESAGAAHRAGLMGQTEVSSELVLATLIGLVAGLLGAGAVLAWRRGPRVSRGPSRPRSRRGRAPLDPARPSKRYDRTAGILEEEMGADYVQYVLERELARVYAHYTTSAVELGDLEQESQSSSEGASSEEASSGEEGSAADSDSAAEESAAGSDSAGEESSAEDSESAGSEESDNETPPAAPPDQKKRPRAGPTVAIIGESPPRRRSGRVRHRRARPAKERVRTGLAPDPIPAEARPEAGVVDAARPDSVD